MDFCLSFRCIFFIIISLVAFKNRGLDIFRWTEYDTWLINSVFTRAHSLFLFLSNSGQCINNNIIIPIYQSNTSAPVPTWRGFAIGARGSKTAATKGSFITIMDIMAKTLKRERNIIRGFCCSLCVTPFPSASALKRPSLNALYAILEPSL